MATTKNLVKSFHQMFKSELHALIPKIQDKSHTMEELIMILLPMRQSGYNLYQKMMYQTMLEDPAPFKEKSKSISKKWKKLSEEERDTWNDKAAKLKDSVVVESSIDEEINPPVINICKGIIKNTHQPCKSKAKFNGYCGKHKKQANDNNFTSIEHTIVEENTSKTEKTIDGVIYWIDFYNKVYETESSDTHIGYFDTETEKIQVLDENMDF